MQGLPQTPRPMREVLFGAFSRRLALLVVIGALVMPPGGIGLDLCWFHARTGLPCPGCGLTRSLASLAHLELERALSLHPFGPPLLAALSLIALSGLPGERRRAPLLAWLDRHDAVIRRLYTATIVAFVAFGIARLGVALTHPDALASALFARSPWEL